MHEDIVIFGAGPAGLAAAGTLARAGQRVTVFEQRVSIGGAVHRQPIPGASPLPPLRHDQARWQQLQALARHPGITFRHQVSFAGLDSTGLILAEDRANGTTLRLRARALILALGAVESVRPLPGWELAGVSTAGGLQVQMKETGLAPTGDVILAGTGPLLVVLAAQMASLGKAPTAIVELGNPTGLRAGLRLLARQPGVALSGIAPLLRVLTSDTRYLRGAELLGIQPDGTRLTAVIRHGARTLQLSADRIGLHHGIRPNAYGLPPDNLSPAAGQPFVLRAGDCDLALGADAAVSSGQDKARRLLARLAGQSDPGPCAEMALHQRSQQLLWQGFAPVTAPRRLRDLPDDTILCRCEQRRIGDLKQLTARQDQLGPREIKHNGRFGMGACQGRFCAHNTLELLQDLRSDSAELAAPEQLTGQRWPTRPVSVAALLTAADPPQD